MIVLLDAEQFDDPKTYNNLLDHFFFTKSEILRIINPIIPIIVATNTHIVVTLTPQVTKINFIPEKSPIVEKIKDLLDKYFEVDAYLKNKNKADSN
jgi:hypothetical protein